MEREEDAELTFKEEEAAYLQLLNQPKDIKRRSKWKAASGWYNDRHIAEHDSIEVENDSGWWQILKRLITGKKRGYQEDWRRRKEHFTYTSQDLAEDWLLTPQPIVINWSISFASAYQPHPRAHLLVMHPQNHRPYSSLNSRSQPSFFLQSLLPFHLIDIKSTSLFSIIQEISIFCCKSHKHSMRGSQSHSS